MIEVGVRIEEFLAGRSIAKLNPGTDAHTGGAPTGASNLFRLLGEPEGAAIDLLKPALTKKDKAPFSLTRSIVTSHTYWGVIREGSNELIVLIGTHLLKPEQVWVEGANCGGEKVLPMSPMVLSIFGV